MTTLPVETVYTARATPLATLLNPARVLGLLWRERDLIRQFTQREIQAAHRDTALGLLWSVLSPLAMLAVYTLAFGVILQRKEHPAQYAVQLYCGLTLFQLFTEPLSRGPGLVANRPNFVKRLVFPLEVLPISAVGSAMFFALISLGLLVLAKALVFGRFTGWEVLFPLALVPAALLGLGVCTLMAAIGVFVPDLRNIVGGPVTRAMFFLTPIFYTLKQVPEGMRWLIGLNPLTTIVEFGRETLFDGRLPDTALWIQLGVVTLVGVVGVFVSFGVFAKAKRGFADVL